MKEPVLEKEKQICSRINSSNVLGTVGFCSLIGAVGTVEENILVCLVLCAVFTGCAYFAIKESGGK